eukprot:COSAG02_NODE_1410_length_12758_cov_67.963504_3_plen_534_part_00
MVKARGGRVCPRGRLFFSSPTENGDAVDGGRVGFIPDSRWRGPCTSREDVLLGDVRIPLRADTLFRVLQCDTQSERRGRRGQRGKRRTASTVIKTRSVQSCEMTRTQVCKPKKICPYLKTMSAKDEIREFLKSTGRDVGRAVGDHLAGMAKDRAVAYVQGLIGEGLQDELGAVASSVGRAGLASALTQLGNVRDTTSAKRAAGSVGRAIVDEGGSQLVKLAQRHFGGSGTPEQAVKVCAYTLASLRKIVTAFRRAQSKMPVNDFLMGHAERALAQNVIGLKKNQDLGTRLRLFTEAVHEPPSRGGYSMAEKRKLVTRVRKAFYPPVSSMSRLDIIQMIYALAKDQNVNWEPFFEQATEKRRIPKGCYKMRGPGNVDYEPPKPRKKRAPSAFNKFVKEHMLTYQFPSHFSQTDKMKEIGKLWRQEKTSILDEEHAQEVEREDRIEARKKARQMGARKRLKGRDKRVPKKGADDDLMLGEGLRDLLKRKPSDADREKAARAALQAVLTETTLGQPLRGTSVASGAVHMAKQLLAE